MSQVESGARTINLDLLNKYAEVFDMSVSTIFIIHEHISVQSRYKVHQPPKQCKLIINWINTNES